MVYSIEEELDAENGGGERIRNKSHAASVVENSDANDVNVTKLTVMHGKNVADILSPWDQREKWNDTNGFIRAIGIGVLHDL